MESKEFLFAIVCLFILITDFRVYGMSTVNTDFERYLRAINSSTTVPNVEERVVIDSYILAFLNYSYINSEGKPVSFSEEKARYGEGKILNVEGLLVHISSSSDVNDDRACKSDILGTRGDSFPTSQWIALVRRGECTFEEKVKNVALRGAVGVIIYNDKPVMNLEKMQIKDKNRNITAVMTYQEIGQDMASIVDQGFEVFASITRGRSGVRPINTLNKTSVLFVSISFIVLMIISLVWLIFYYIQRFRYLQSKDQQSRHLCSVTKRAIMKIPTKTGKGNEKDGDSDCCAICIEAYKSSDCIRVLPCKHEFHKNCIDPWLIEHRTCPMCKLDVLKYYGYVVGEQTSATLSSTAANERIINANDHMIITPSNMISSHFGNSNNNSSNISNSNSNSGSYPVNVIMIGRAIPTSTDTATAPSSDSRVNFLGSEECIMELEGSYFDNTSAIVDMTSNENAPQSVPIAGSVTLQIEHWERRLRNFNLTPNQVLYRHELPERSQSSLSFVSNNQLACSMTNRLGAQQGVVRRMRKPSQTEETMSLADAVKRRRSRSADSRFSQGCYGRRESFVDRSKIASTSRGSRTHLVSVHSPEVRIQINGEGVEI